MSTPASTSSVSPSPPVAASAAIPNQPQSASTPVSMQHDVAPPPAKPRRWRRWYFFLTCLLAGVLFVGLVAYMRELERSALHSPDYAASLSPGASVRQTARVVESVRVLKLDTVEIWTRVSSESADSSWRGSASATVEVPVKLTFGTDLSHLDEGALSFSPLMNSCVVRVPPPARIHTEVIGNQEENRVHVGWLRFRAQAGEKHLSTARRDLYEQALELRLLPEDAQRVREDTRQQVAKLMHSIVGKETTVRVIFSDEPGGAPLPSRENVPSDPSAPRRLNDGPTIHVPAASSGTNEQGEAPSGIGGSR